jgi:hypothetical protein
LTCRWLRFAGAGFVAVIALSGLAIVGSAIQVCVSARSLINSASTIRTISDAEREFGRWRERWGDESWMEDIDSGRGVNYYTRVTNRAASRSRLVPSSDVVVRVTMRDRELVCVAVFINSPTAPVAIQEWFTPGVRSHFHLSFLKGAPPMATVEFPHTLPDFQRRRGFSVNTRCLVVPGQCEKPEDVLSVIRELESGSAPD